MAMKVEIIDDLLKNCKTADDFFGEGGLVKQFVKAVSERALQAELTTHLNYEKHDIKGKKSGNSRNGTSPKMVKGEFGQAEIAIPRDRAGTFEPQLIQKSQTRFDGFDDKILSMRLKPGNHDHLINVPDYFLTLWLLKSALISK